MSLRTQPLTVPDQIQDIYEKLRKLHPPTNILQLIQNAIDNNPCDCGCMMLPGSKSFFEAGIIGIEASNEIWYPPFPLTIRSVRATARTSTGLNTVDVNVNGVTIFTDQTHRPQITSSGSNVTALASGIDLPIMILGDYLNFEVDEGNGEDLSIEIGYVVDCDVLEVPTIGTGSPKSTYDQAVLADSPILYLKLTDSSGTTAVDSSGYAHNGTYHGSPTLGVAGPLTDGTPAVQFDGVNDYVDCTIDFSAYTQLTVECWLEVASYADDDHLLCEYTANFNADNVGGFIANPDSSSDSKFDLGMHTNSSNYVVRNFTRPSTGVFHHLFFRFDRAALPNGTADAVIDGVPVTMGGIATTPLGDNFGNSTLYIMSRAGSSLFRAGTVGRFAVYAGLLSNSRALVHYNAGIGI